MRECNWLSFIGWISVAHPPEVDGLHGKYLKTGIGTLKISIEFIVEGENRFFLYGVIGPK